MKLLFALAALGAVLFLVRFMRRSFAESLQRKARDRRAIESRAEQDRQDCRSLEMKVKESSPESDSATAGEMREARRRSTAAHSAFDPDLPAPVKDSAARA